MPGALGLGGPAAALTSPGIERPAARAGLQHGAGEAGPGPRGKGVRRAPRSPRAPGQDSFAAGQTRGGLMTVFPLEPVLIPTPEPLTNGTRSPLRALFWEALPFSILR